MMQKLNIAFRVIAISLVGFVPLHSTSAQTAPVPSLESQLKEHYKLTKTGSDSTGFAIVEPGTVLVIRKGGILGAPPASPTIAPATYKDGELHSPSAPAGNGTRFLSVDEKVYFTNVDVNLKNDKVAIAIIECDSVTARRSRLFTNPWWPFSFRRAI